MSAFDVLHNALSSQYQTAVEQTRAIEDALAAAGLSIVRTPTREAISEGIRQGIVEGSWELSEADIDTATDNVLDVFDLRTS